VRLHAFLWRHGVLLDLGALAAEEYSAAATDINSRGDITGSSTVAGSYAYHAVMWQPTGSDG
jgi:hypothetical protein